ncbi:SHOCT domain-containing protein [Streptomyces sp. NPDC059491]|uniref:SHOCT domain-containing protein n=1 Tax=Streptomyces sp. NPDC059491 TaxID=3346850 RepID=UPI00368922FE
MMFWYGNGMNGWGWFAMSAGTVLFWVFLVTAAVLIFRTLDRASAARPAPPGIAAPERILGERLARGEIDEEEYRRRLGALRSGDR